MKICGACKGERLTVVDGKLAGECSVCKGCEGVWEMVVGHDGQVRLTKILERQGECSE